jgi:hypothetical protein
MFAYCEDVDYYGPDGSSFTFDMISLHLHPGDFVLAWVEMRM